MGTMKQQQIEAEGKGRKMTPFEKQMFNYNTTHNMMSDCYPHLHAALLDEESPCVQFNFKRADHGGFLVILKREHVAQMQVIITGGEDIYDAFGMLDKKVRRDAWKQDSPWPPPGR